MLGYSRDELIGTNLRDYMTRRRRSRRRGARPQRKLSGEVTGTTFEQEFIAKDGHSVVLEVSSRVIEENGRPVGIQGICRDITARKQAELELRRLSELNRHQALHDSLTGPARTAPASASRSSTRSASPTQDGSQLAVLLIDLDRFKEINDTLGHHYGDLLLVELARRLESVLRRSDTVARLGGDEFGILVRQLVDSRRTTSSRRSSGSSRRSSSRSWSTACRSTSRRASASRAIPAHGGDVDLLLQRADVAMYLAKETGAPHAALRRRARPPRHGRA